MPIYGIAGMSVSVENIDFPLFEQRMGKYLKKDGTQQPDLQISFSEKEFISEPEGELIGTRIGYRTYLKTARGEYVNFDKLKDSDNRTSLMIANEDFTKVEGVIRDLEPLGGAPLDVRFFNMMGEIFRMALIMRDGLVVHSSSIAVDGQGILFSALSGTGKSTHTGLWKQCYPDQVTIINDDSPAVIFKDGTPYVCGTPWSGKTDINENICVPLRAIVFLTQAKENTIQVLKPQDAVFELMRAIAVYPYRDMANRVLETADRLLGQVPCYMLGCRPDEEAVQTVKNALEIGV